MYAIVPLAGPGLGEGVPPPFDDEMHLFEYCLESRPWKRSGELEEKRLIFVLRQTAQAESIFRHIARRYPESKQIVLSHLSRGALMSALAGVSLIEDLSTPLVIDLADIAFSADFSPTELFHRHRRLGGLVPYFHSQKSCYSYITMNRDRHVLECAEKKLISSHATAGCYFFRNLHLFMRCADNSLQTEDPYKYYLAPLFNVLPRINFYAEGIAVDQVQEYSADLHRIRKHVSANH